MMSTAAAHLSVTDRARGIRSGGMEWNGGHH